MLQNLKAGALERHELGAQELLALRPSLIVCNVGAFGASGPLRDKPGYDPLDAGLQRHDEPSRQ